ncbi:MAG TPA: CDGSH iron-sulfur domain-containing protein [Gemmatimonadales bacterium]|nr:CDGSH iron-sulfur domain-containing protein [Gemmatimonadales bacterium]
MPDEAPSPPTVTWKPSGPLHVSGDVRFFDSEGTELVPPPTKTPGVVKLCGCGRSKTKPFCDGSHKC